MRLVCGLSGQQGDQYSGFQKCRYFHLVQPLFLILLKIANRKDARTFEKPVN